MSIFKLVLPTVLTLISATALAQSIECAALYIEIPWYLGTEFSVLPGKSMKAFHSGSLICEKPRKSCDDGTHPRQMKNLGRVEIHSELKGFSFAHVNNDTTVKLCFTDFGGKNLGTIVGNETYEGIAGTSVPLIGLFGTFASNGSSELYALFSTAGLSLGAVPAKASWEFEHKNKTSYPGSLIINRIDYNPIDYIYGGGAPCPF